MKRSISFFKFACSMFRKMFFMRSMSFISKGVAWEGVGVEIIERLEEDDGPDGIEVINSLGESDFGCLARINE